MLCLRTLQLIACTMHVIADHGIDRDETNSWRTCVDLGMFWLQCVANFDCRDGTCELCFPGDAVVTV